MNREIAQQWVNALRSGEYVQGTGRLHYKVDDTDNFCCLGVLCDLAYKNGKVNKIQKSGGVIGYGSQFRMTSLPEEVVNWADLNSQDPHLVTMDGLMLSASALNDGEGWTFDEIADAIGEKFLS